MSVVNNRGIKWQQVAGIGVICGLAVTGCNRSDNKTNETEATQNNEQPTVGDSVAPAVSCDNPLVQERLRASLQNMLYQQAQLLTTNYANDAEVSFESGAVSSKVNGIVIDVQNAAVLQEANANGMTTCQASVSMVLPSEDLYQASQISAANNQPSLQMRLAQGNIRVNNNMLIDEAFTYVAGAQGGQVRVRVAGQPALITIVADIIAGSLLKSAIDGQRVQVPLQEQPRRRDPVQNSNVQNSNQDQPIRQQPKPKPVQPAKPATPAQAPKPAQPVKPVQPVQPKPPLPPTISEANKTTITKPSADNKAAEVKTPTPPKTSVPKDDSIDMVIIEDNSATY